MSDIATQRRIRGIEDTIDRLRTMAQGIAIGTSMPANPSTNDLVYRTDWGLICYYDGTRWLTTFHYHGTNGTPVVVSANGSHLLTPIRGDAAPYVDRVVVEYIVQTTNDGTNYWTVDLRGVNASYGATSTIHSFNTSAATVNVWTQVDTGPGTTNTPSNRAFFDMNLTKTNAPGNISIMVTLYYRLIIT